MRSRIARMRFITAGAAAVETRRQPCILSIFATAVSVGDVVVRRSEICLTCGRRRDSPGGKHSRGRGLQSADSCVPTGTGAGGKGAGLTRRIPMQSQALHATVSGMLAKETASV